MWERLLIALVLWLLATAVYRLVKRWHGEQVKQRLQTTTASTTPTILYFGSEACAACPSQARYLDQLNGDWHGRITIQKIDAVREPEQASQYRVFTLPTTILIDPAGQVRQINYGLTSTHTLNKQVARLQAMAG